jgi:hypothetical protein
MKMAPSLIKRRIDELRHLADLYKDAENDARQMALRMNSIQKRMMKVVSTIPQEDRKLFADKIEATLTRAKVL